MSIQQFLIKLRYQIRGKRYQHLRYYHSDYRATKNEQGYVVDFDGRQYCASTLSHLLGAVVDAHRALGEVGESSENAL